MAEWLPMLALPSIKLRQAIELDGFALASIHDARIQELAADGHAAEKQVAGQEGIHLRAEYVRTAAWQRARIGR
jgi:hypothetical protein